MFVCVWGGHVCRCGLASGAGGMLLHRPGTGTGARSMLLSCMHSLACVEMLHAAFG